MRISPEMPNDSDATTEIANTFLLGSICRGWRQLTQSTPGLWSTLSFTLVKPTKQVYFPQLRNWLQLAGSLPLTITIFDHRGTAALSRRTNVSPSLTGPFRTFHPSIFRRFCGTSPLRPSGPG